MKKIIISEQMLKELNIKPENKDKFIANGDRQYTFKSSDPDKVVKFGRNKNEDSINDKDFVKRIYTTEELYEFKVMAKYPQWFPIIYKIGKDYVYIETLNTTKAKEDWEEIVIYIRNYYIKTGLNPVLFDNILEDFRDNFIDPDYKQLYINLWHKSKSRKFIDLVKNIYNERLFGLTDIHEGQFGYDKNGNLKMLDV